jgi:hypothetical protein
MRPRGLDLTCPACDGWLVMGAVNTSASFYEQHLAVALDFTCLNCGACARLHIRTGVGEIVETQWEVLHDAETPAGPVS